MDEEFMRKLMFISLIIVLVLCQNVIAKDKVILTATYNKSFFETRSCDMVGLNLEIFISKNVSLNYSVLLGGDGRNFALHSTGGLVGGIHLLGYALDAIAEDDGESSSAFYGVSTIFALMLPEGVNLHLPLSQYVTLVPYIHPLGYDYFGPQETLSSSLGLKVMYNIDDKLLVIPQIGVSLFYASENTTNYNLGVSVGYKF